MESNTNNDNTGISVLFFVLGLAFVIWLLASCSSHHYFSINAEEITNPAIMYSDSTSLTNPF